MHIGCFVRQTYIHIGCFVRHIYIQVCLWDLQDRRDDDRTALPRHEPHQVRNHVVIMLWKTADLRSDQNWWVHHIITPLETLRQWVTATISLEYQPTPWFLRPDASWCIRIHPNTSRYILLYPCRMSNLHTLLGYQEIPRFTWNPWQMVSCERKPFCGKSFFKNIFDKLINRVSWWLASTLEIM